MSSVEGTKSPLLRLLPCPFCGGTAVLCKNMFTDVPNNHQYVCCEYCLSRTAYYGTAAAAVNAWNQRTNYREPSAGNR